MHVCLYTCLCLCLCLSSTSLIKTPVLPCKRSPFAYYGCHPASCMQFLSAANSPVGKLKIFKMAREGYKLARR